MYKIGLSQVNDLISLDQLKPIQHAFDRDIQGR